MNGLFEDYKYLYDMYLKQFDYPANSSAGVC